jgi:hypothetical protein
VARRKLEPDSLLVVLTDRVGLVNAMKVLTFIASWGIATEDLGHPPDTIEEYAYWWRSSAATGYREQRLFREAMRDETATPTAIWEQVRGQLDAKDRKRADRSAAKLGGLRVAL